MQLKLRERPTGSQHPAPLLLSRAMQTPAVSRVKLAAYMLSVAKRVLVKLGALPNSREGYERLKLVKRTSSDVSMSARSNPLGLRLKP